MTFPDLHKTLPRIQSYFKLNKNNPDAIPARLRHLGAWWLTNKPYLWDCKTGVLFGHLLRLDQVGGNSRVGELLACDRQGVPIVAADHVKNCIRLIGGQSVCGPELTILLDDKMGVDEIILKGQLFSDSGCMLVRVVGIMNSLGGI